MKRIRMTMAQAVVRFLDKQYVSYDGKEHKFVNGVFSIFGHGCCVGMGEALADTRKDHRLRVFQGRNEQGMANAAVAYAKQKNRLGIMPCLSSIGPGATNMITAAATATVNRVPALFLPGDNFASRQPDPVLQQVERFHDLSLTVNDAFRPVCVFWDRIVRPEQVMSSLLQAMRVLTSPADTGAVCISLSQDVQGEAYDYPATFFEKRVHVIKRVQPSVEEISMAVDLILQKKKPLLLLGGGVRYSLAGEAFLKLAEQCHIPFAETQAGKGVVPFDHRLNLGGMGVTGTKVAFETAREADCLIAVGTRLNDFVTASKSAFSNKDFDVLAINASAFDTVKLNAHPIVADAKETLNALSKALHKAGYKSAYGTGQQSELVRRQKSWGDEVSRLYNLDDKVLPQTTVLGDLNEKLLPKDAVVVNASGSLPADLERLWKTKAEGGYHLEYGNSCMGYEVCGALGVKIADPNREVFAFVGDGAYLMLHSELVTSLQEGIKINVILFDNCGFHCIDNLQNSQGIDSYACQFLQRDKNGKLRGDDVVIDYAANAKSYGCNTWTVKTREQLAQAVRGALASKVSTLIDVKVGKKTMTGGYGSWWRVGTPEVSPSKEVQKVYEKFKKAIPTLRDY